jgi:hypothetical protein
LTTTPVASSGEPRSERPRRPRLRLLSSIVGSLAVVGLLVYLLASNGTKIEQAARRTSVADLVLVTLLALITLLARTEAVVACLSAMGQRPHRREIHSSNSLTFLAAFVNHYLSSVVRAALMRRVDRERSPTIPQMIMVDTSTTLIEGLVVALLVVASASALKLAWWIPVLLVVAGGAGIAVALGARRRFLHLGVFRGLDVLAHARQRNVVAGLMVVVVMTQVLRTLVVLRAVGLHPSLLQAAATFVAGGILSSLFAGPGGGTAAGPLLVFGHQSLAASAAAGLELSITSLIAGIIYAVSGGPLFVWRLRQIQT